MARRLNRLSGRWHAGLPAVTAEIDCGGEQHRITWRRGKLVLEDHDIVAERSLTALGAESCTCVEVLDAWREASESRPLSELLVTERTLSAEELSLRRRSREAVLADTRRSAEQMRARFANHPQLGSMMTHAERSMADRLEREQRLWMLSLIEALPAALRRTLGMSVVVNLERHWDDEEFRDGHQWQIEHVLRTLVGPLFEESARRGRRSLRPHAHFLPETWLLSPGEQPTRVAWSDRERAYAALSLPLSWFTDVWGRGIALVDGCLVTGVAERSQDCAWHRASALRWERQDERIWRAVEAPAVVMRAGADWRLSWL